MKKALLFIAGLAILVYGFYNYQQRHIANLATQPSPATQTTGLNDNSNTANISTVTEHCANASDISQITNQSYSLQNEVYTAAVMLLECTYQRTEQLSNVYPTITYKLQLTNDAHGIWSRQQTKTKRTPSYKDSSDFPDAFANLNPVREIDQGSFYGFVNGKYVTLTYTPVAEGTNQLFTDGMKLVQKALVN